MDIIWHRKDLRTSDNACISNSDEFIPLYVFDENITDFAHARRMEWVIRNVRSLKEDYRSSGGDLVVHTGNPIEKILSLSEEYKIDRVLWNKSYTKLGKSRDKKVKSALDSNGLSYESFHGEVIHEPESIYTNKGDPYSVFTYYHRKWKDRDKREPYDDLSGSDVSKVKSTEDIPDIVDLGFDKPTVDMPESGTDEANARLDNFLSNCVSDYEEERDNPIQDVTSRLSPYLSYGVIGIRNVWNKTTRYDNAQAFQEQLAWRDFYHQVMYHNPKLVTQNYKDYENDIEWENDSKNLQRWKDGETGYPIVDAGMRQLRKEAWMHNRLRMIVASFLTKDLLIDWREGYKWFKKMLIDHNTANNNGGWQWAASTGTDAQPYFRIFNPMTQGEDHDEQARYIKKYVPELEDVPPEKIHNWNKLSDEERRNLAPQYEHPIVNHSERREDALDMYKRARGDK